MAPGHVAPDVAARIVLVEEMVEAPVEEQSIGVVQPIPVCGVVDSWPEPLLIRFRQRTFPDHPFTPLEAMLLMKERWNAMNRPTTGSVINEAYAITSPQETLSWKKYL